MSPDDAKTNYSQNQNMALISDLNVINPNHQNLFSEALNEEKVTGWSYYFPYLQMFSSIGGKERLLFESLEGSIAVYRVRERRDKMDLSLFVPPFPWNDRLLQRGIERSEAFNSDHRGRITRISEDCLPRVARLGLDIRFNMEEYVYDRAAVVEANGSSYATLRRKVSKFSGSNTVTRPYMPDDAAECTELLDNWRHHLEAQGVRVGPYQRYSRVCLENSTAFGETMKGEVVLFDDRIVAFSFGGPIDDECGSIFITVSDHALPGLAYFQRASLMGLFPELRYFNDTSDTGRAGLAQMKRTFRPVRMHVLCSAKSRRASN